MALLGVHGEVFFSREWAQPTIVDGARLVPGTPNTLDLGNPAFWSGDRVLLVCQRGIPVKLPGLQYAPCPSGYSFYGGGEFETGPAVASRTRNGAMYFGADSPRPFYEQAPSVSLATSAYVYIHRDELDNITFYSEESEALNGEGESLLPISILDSGPILIAPAPTGNYPLAVINEILPFLSPLLFSELLLGGDGEILSDQVLPQQLTDSISDLLEQFAEEGGWSRVANLTSWVFETNVDLLDQNAIGQQFGESAKGALKGAGSFNAIINTAEKKEYLSPSSMLRLMFVTQVGAKGKARFIIADNSRADVTCKSPRKVYYETPLLISNTNVNVAFDEIITMSIQFVATGKIRIASSRG
jgi:hypothetical protein